MRLLTALLLVLLLPALLLPGRALSSEDELKVLVVARGFGSKPLPANLVETWLKEDGQWWFYQKD